MLGCRCRAFGGGGRIENSKLRALWGLGITWTPKECRRIAFNLRGFWAIILPTLGGLGG